MNFRGGLALGLNLLKLEVLKAGMSCSSLELQLTLLSYPRLELSHSELSLWKIGWSELARASKLGQSVAASCPIPDPVVYFHKQK